jgi:hypothetical protein
MMNNLSFCIDSAQHRALDFCGGSMNTGQGYGDGADYGDMLGWGRGSGEQIVLYDACDYGDGYGDGSVGAPELDYGYRDGDGESKTVWSNKRTY